MDETRNKHDLLILVILAIAFFAISCFVRIVLANFPKGIGVLPDEIRYLNLASSLLNDGALIERGGISSFQKILYPVSLIPAYLIGDAMTRAQAVTILNCIYVSSAVFPALVIARRLFRGKAPIIACLAFTLIVPDMCYSMTFLSESVYLPLALWLIACCLRAIEAQGRSKIIWCLVSGLLCYLAYLCKEVALGFVLAFLLMMAIALVRDDEKRKENVVATISYIAGLAIPFVILKLTLFSGLLNSYNQTDPSILTNPYTVLFSFYALVMDSMHFIVAFAFFPLFLPAFTWPRLTRRERDLYVFCLSSFIFILIAVVYTISIREDVGHIGIRPHVRYVAPIFLPLLFLTIKQVLRHDGEGIVRNPSRFTAMLITTIAMSFLVVFMLGAGDYSQGFDYAQLHVIRLVVETFGGLPVDPTSDVSGSEMSDSIYHGDWLEINPVIWSIRIAFVAFIAICTLLLMDKHRFGGGIFMLACIALWMLGNSYGAYLYNDSVYKVNESDVQQTCAVENFIDNAPDGEQILIVYDNDSSSLNNLMDVYIDNSRLNCVYIQLDDFKRVVEEDGGSQMRMLVESDATMGDNIYAANGRTCNDEMGIQYVIVHSGQSLRIDTAQARNVTPAGISSYKIYRIDEGADIALL